MVDSDVSFQVGLNLHSMITVITLVWLLSGVGSDVTCEVAVGLEGCGTIWLLASKGSIACVSAEVNSELTAVLAPVRADLAVVRSLVRVHSHVLLQSAPVHSFVRTSGA